MKTYTVGKAGGAFKSTRCLASLTGPSMIRLSSIAFMFSCFRIKPAAATIITLSILFVDMIPQNFPFFKPYESWFVIGWMAFQTRDFKT